ncbi:MAG: benzoate-CoA ligase family protein [Acidimicrobiales bacterium]
MGTFNAAEWLVDRHLSGGQGGNVAFVCEDRRLDYDGLQASVWAAANGLAAIGVNPGDRVLMVVNDEEAFPAAFLGGLLIGAVPIPVSTMLRASDVAVLAADSECRAAVLSARYAGYLPEMAAAADGLRAAVVVGDGGASGGGAGGVVVHSWSDLDDKSEVVPAATSPESPGFWLYTSGTTGKPKGAIHRHGDIKVVCDTYARTVLGITPDDLCYSVAKLFFAFGLGNALLFPLSVGASALIDPEPPTPARVAELAARHRPTLFFSSPGFCSALVDSGAPGESLASARFTVTAGEALPAEVIRRFTARFGTEMLDGIGSTEALHIFCSNHPGDVRPGTSGRPVEGYSLKLVGDDGSELTEPETPGYLWVKGESVAAGYWRRPEVTAETFVDGWLRTGDVYTCSEDGYYRFYGRNSDMIKPGGIWVSPAEVESALLEHDDVLEAAVVGGHDPEGLEVSIAFVVARQGHTIDVEALQAHCRSRMAAFKRPRQVHVVSELPKTATGKIRRFELRDQLAAGQPV